MSPADSTLDNYMVLTGPRGAAASSRMSTRPFVIDHVYLFDQRSLLTVLGERGTKIGVATSVPQALWEAAEIYPSERNPVWSLSTEQSSLLAVFSSLQASAFAGVRGLV